MTADTVGTERFYSLLLLLCLSSKNRSNRSLATHLQTLAVAPVWEDVCLLRCSRSRVRQHCPARELCCFSHTCALASRTNSKDSYSCIRHWSHTLWPVSVKSVAFNKCKKKKVSCVLQNLFFWWTFPPCSANHLLFIPCRVHPSSLRAAETLVSPVRLRRGHEEFSRLC